MIYDLTQINNELDLLEIRLNILNPHVDKFVIGESTLTFSNKKKPLYFQENKERFKQWEDKIIHVIIPEMVNENIYERTAFQKDYLRTALKDCQPDDVIYYGDVDEVWTPQTREGKLRQLNYSYYLNNRSSEDWQGTNMCLYKNLRDLNELRKDHSVILENGGWHFTNQQGFESILNKVASYDHSEEIPQDWFKEQLQGRIDRGEDYLGRTHDWQGKPFKMWTDDSQLPQYLLENKEKWKHLFK